MRWRPVRTEYRRLHGNPDAAVEFLSKEMQLKPAHARKGWEYYTQNHLWPPDGDVTLEGRFKALTLYTGLLQSVDAPKLNGFITVKLRVPSFVTTLGTFYVLQGVVLTTSHAYPAEIPVPLRGTIQRWLGHRVWLVDGSSFSMPDEPELQRHFGQSGTQRPGCGSSRRWRTEILSVRPRSSD